MGFNGYRVINNYTIYEDRVELEIINTKKEKAIVIIDLDDYNKVKEYHWTIRLIDDSYYVKSTSVAIRNLMLHHFVYKKPEKGKVIDHIDREPLNNRKNNLREVSYSVNSSNANPRKESTSKIRGVYRRKARPGISKESWIAEWSIDKKRFSRSFSIEKYGEDLAFELAFNLRKEKEKELKI